jgi:hypothetical protein
MQFFNIAAVGDATLPEEQDRSFSFFLQPVPELPSQRVHFLTAESKSDYNRWFSALRPYTAELCRR